MHDLSFDDLAFMAAHDLHATLLRTTVVTETSGTEDLPAIFGSYEAFDDTLRFVPHLPFEPGVAYRSTFDARPLRRTAASPQRLDFSLPRLPSQPVGVDGVYPSSDLLPANLLRFYVRFSGSMQRGRSACEIRLLDDDGEPVADALYRPPTELWDRDLRHLTVLLDPGRLKRMVGPNRALGPPLVVGRHYTLRVGAGMIDRSGRRLVASVDKRFEVGNEVRRAIAPDRWCVARPGVRTVEPLVLVFAYPLDWALLASAITVASSDGRFLEGRVSVDRDETRWRFVPSSAWRAGDYRIRIADDLEDVCGNTLRSAFDRPIGAGDPHEVGDRSIAFSLP